MQRKENAFRSITHSWWFQVSGIICFREKEIQGKNRIKKCLCDWFFSLVLPAVNKEKDEPLLTCNPHADCEEVAKSKRTSAQGTLNENKGGLILLSEASDSLCALQRRGPTSWKSASVQIPESLTPSSTYFPKLSRYVAYQSREKH